MSTILYYAMTITVSTLRSYRNGGNVMKIYEEDASYYVVSAYLIDNIREDRTSHQNLVKVVAKLPTLVKRCLDLSSLADSRSQR